MRAGVLFCCFNTETQDGKALKYSRLLETLLPDYKNIMPAHYAVITNEYIDAPFDEQIIIDSVPGHTRTSWVQNVHLQYEWKNNVKQMAYHYTPFDRTLLLDADYIIGSNMLKCLLECDSEFMIPRRVRDVSGKGSFDKYIWMPNRTIPQCWATAMVWNQNKAAPYFEYAKQIEENYEYYAEIFGFSANQFRNDFVYSIVAHVMGADDFPFALPFLPSEYAHGNVFRDQTAKIITSVQNQQGDIKYHLGDIHLLPKSFILEK